MVLLLIVIAVVVGIVLLWRCSELRFNSQCHFNYLLTPLSCDFPLFVKSMMQPLYLIL